MMQKDAATLKKRREYVKISYDTRDGKPTAEVRRIARDLFLTERTIYRDLRKAREEQPDIHIERD